MIVVGPGSVRLSDRRTQRTWTVELAPYLLATFPVTQAAYASVTGLSPSFACGADLPVENVSWLDAVAYCNARSVQAGLTPAYTIRDREVGWDASADGFRLPTEAEWEFACRAGTTGARYGDLAAIAWYRGNARDAVHAVGGKEPNAWGLYDMIGNVWEWCWDVYDRDVYGPYRVLRGGGWSDEHWSCRASVRRRSHPTFAIEDVGFRLARSPSSGTGWAETWTCSGADGLRQALDDLGDFLTDAPLEWHTYWPDEPSPGTRVRASRRLAGRDRDALRPLKRRRPRGFSLER
ncbi:MAG TPA: SUMF1/EgtB/PvdO family nonheme iron enzyme [Solirubrobacter sp.]